MTKQLSLHHIIREAKTSNEKAPLLILLHGYGSNEEDLFSFASELLLMIYNLTDIVGMTSTLLQTMKNSLTTNKQKHLAI